MSWGGKNVLVTGGASGIGRALAERFAAEGARVTIADLDEDAARAVAEKTGGRAVLCDVGEEDDVRRAVEAAGDVDLLCSNAGIAFSDAPGWTATSQTNEQWEKILRVNLLAHVFATRAVLPSMVRRGGGTILYTASAAGLLNQIGDASYSTTKHATIGFAESVAITHGDQGIHVAALCPQAVDTAMIHSLQEASGGGLTVENNPAAADGMLPPEKVADAVIEGLAAGTFLILPHPQVRTYMRHKASDVDRWLRGMRRYRRAIFPDDGVMDWGD